MSWQENFQVSERLNVWEQLHQGLRNGKKTAVNLNCAGRRVRKIVLFSFISEKWCKKKNLIMLQNKVERKSNIQYERFCRVKTFNSQHFESDCSLRSTAFNYSRSNSTYTNLLLWIHLQLHTVIVYTKCTTCIIKVHYNVVGAWMEKQTTSPVAAWWRWWDVCVRR